MDAAVGLLYRTPARLMHRPYAQLTAPGAEPVTVAELEAARQAVAGPQGIGNVAQSLEGVAADVLATVAGRWQLHQNRAIDLEHHAQRLLPGLREQRHGVVSAIRALTTGRLALERLPAPG